MNAPTELDTLLNEDSADDYWGDAGIDLGCEIAAVLSEDDWRNLRTTWQSRPSRWQCRFANLLDGVNSKYGVPILLTMLSSSDDRVVLSAVDSLDGLDDSLERYAYFAEPTALVRLKEMQHLADEEEIHIIQEISERIRAGSGR